MPLYRVWHPILTARYIDMLDGNALQNLHLFIKKNTGIEKCYKGFCSALIVVTLS